MATSISDILASVTRAHNAATNYDDNGQREADLQLLTRAWVAERVAPELLPYPSALMERMMSRIRAQIELIEDRTARMDAGTSFALVIIQTELERFKFLVRSFLRTRIAKIDAHTLHILSLHHASPERSALDPTNPLLSLSEAQYAQTHAALLDRHYSASFMSTFPPKLRRLDDKAGAGGVGMVEGPDLNQAVFVRCLGRRVRGKDSSMVQHQLGQEADDDEDMEEEGDDGYGAIEVSCGFVKGQRRRGVGEDDEDILAQDEQQSAGERFVRMRRGDVWIVRWSSVKEAIARGECELI